MNPTTRLVSLAVAATVSIAAVAVAQATTAPSTPDVLQPIRQLDRAAADAAVGAPDPQAAAAQQTAKASLVRQLIAAPRSTPEAIKYLGDR